MLLMQDFGKFVVRPESSSPWPCRVGYGILVDVSSDFIEVEPSASVFIN